MLKRKILFLHSKKANKLYFKVNLCNLFAFFLEKPLI